ncbi:NAD(P)-dependent alcohol dehydrogenase [Actinokineospora guangxiensis]|uniref:NAD(P)-dependent alcohol dehydrogenase n=1 Tax=Actinokineospora guangxiensis TaxID=1490288 RepID=A0ABW0ESE3_9PSEU
MRAAVVDRYGPPEVARVTDVPRPEPRAGEVLVRVRAAAVNSSDARIRGARFPSGFGLFARLAFGIGKPRRAVLGGALSGEVVALGGQVDGFAVGEAVCGMTGARMGAHAEYAAVRASTLARKPDAVSHEDAAAILFGGTTALHFLRRRTSVGPGTSVLVNGASGAIGTSAVQLARHLGATVTGVTSAANADLVRGLGAERVIDYTRVDLAEIPDRFDVVLDTVGSLSIASGRRLLAPGGTVALIVAGLGELLRTRGNVVAGPAPERVEDYDFLLNLVADKELTVVVDQTFDLLAIVDAYRRIDSGRKVGNIVVLP